MPLSSSYQPFTEVHGVFYRAVDPRFKDQALQGSRAAGRYSSAAQSTLYLSSSPQGVEAAMIAHRGQRAASLEVLQIAVDSDQILDLRDEAACRSAEINVQDATAPWRDLIAQGGRPKSWDVRDRVLATGAVGLIDPSRKAPGLWHLVLFSWNSDASSARVRLLR
jgi:RES domain-containing protein